MTTGFDLSLNPGDEPIIKISLSQSEAHRLLLGYRHRPQPWTAPDLDEFFGALWRVWADTVGR